MGCGDFPYLDWLTLQYKEKAKSSESGDWIDCLKVTRMSLAMIWRITMLILQSAKKDNKIMQNRFQGEHFALILCKKLLQ